MTTIRLTAAQAMVKWLSVQMTADGERFIEGVWAVFGHGNVAGLGERRRRTRPAGEFGATFDLDHATFELGSKA